VTIDLKLVGFMDRISRSQYFIGVAVVVSGIFGITIVRGISCFFFLSARALKHRSERMCPLHILACTFRTRVTASNGNRFQPTAIQSHTPIYKV
jgi:hypothetical protein